MLGRGVQSIYASDACEIDLARRELRILGSPVPVGQRAFEIIEVLARSAGELVTKDELMNRIWPGAVVLENTLQVHAVAIRKALGPYRGLLKTESRRGYRLLGEWTVRHHAAARPPVGLQQIRVSSESPAGNIPVAVTRPVGRSAAVQHLRTLVSAYRIVTLTGPGGIGKTTLALKVARRILGEFNDGGWLVELASLADPALVPSAVAHVLGLKLGGDTISAEAVARTVGARNLLLVLDNCEHVIDAVATLAELLARWCPRVTILATSREIFRVDGEYVYRVPALDVPAAGQAEPEQILGHSAVQLFIARMAAMQSGVLSEQRDAPTISAICRRLDGIPLAIEFAAARAAMLGLDQVAARLDDRFGLLTGGRRTALPRHRTLRATLDWSYELLPEAERCLLRRLAVFPAGFTLEAATAVMRDAGQDQSEVIAGIANLVAKSLIGSDGSLPGGRWRLLETIRAYALLKLGENGEAAQAARFHAGFFRDLVTSEAPGSRSDTALTGLTRCLREIDNVRAALDWSFSRDGDPEIGVSLTAAYVPVWIHSALLVECLERTERALGGLDCAMGLSARLRWQLHMAFGFAGIFTVRPIGATRAVLAAGLDIAESVDDPEAVLWALWGLWTLHCYSGECRAALGLAQRLAAVASRIGEPVALVMADRVVGNTLHFQGEQRRAQGYLERVIAWSGAPGERHYTFYPALDQRVSARAMLARTLLLQGYLDQAAAQARTCLEEATATDHGLRVCEVLRVAVCPLALMTGDLATAEQEIARLLDIATRSNAPFWTSAGRCLEGKLLIERGDFAAGCDLLRSEIEVCESTGWTNWYPELLGVLAEALAGLGRLSEALGSVEQALAKAYHGGELWCVAGLFSVKASIVLEIGGDQSAAGAEEYLCQRAGRRPGARRSVLGIARGDGVGPLAGQAGAPG